MARPRLVTRAASLGLTAWAVVLLASIALGDVLNRAGVHIVLPTPPVLGARPGVQDARLLLPLLAGAALVMVLPRMASRVRWRLLLAMTAAGFTIWTLALALAEGADGLTRGPSDHTEYLHDVPAVRAGLGSFLRTFTERIGDYEIHVRGHPPGFVVLLAGLDRVGLHGAGGEAFVVLVAAATAPVAVLLALRDAAGEAWARRAAPWLCVSPAAIWVATSADAFSMAVAGWAIALVVLASSPARSSGASVRMSIGAGTLGAAALLCSYGLALAAAIPALVLWHRRAWQAALVAAGVASGWLVLFWLVTGFSWIAGLRATSHEYFVLDLDRGYLAFALINLGAWALALGPATAAGLTELRDRRAWLLVGGGVAAALLADVSGMSRGEVERIWLPFTLWVLPAGAALATSHARTRAYLSLQVLTAVALISIVQTQW